MAERATGSFIGHVVFHRFEDDSVFETGLDTEQVGVGRGYALEVSRALMDHAFRIMGLSKVVVEAVPDNVNAKKVIEKLGMRREGETAEGLELWSLSRSDYSRMMQE